MNNSNILKSPFVLVIVVMSILSTSAQELKLPASEIEIKYISDLFVDISVADQKYRGYLQHKTTDEELLSQIDSVYNQVGIKEGFVFEKSLKLTMEPEVRDSILKLQRVLDFRNHIILRGLLETYGMIPENLIKEKNYVQTLLLLHPPAEWNIPTYHQYYGEKLLEEVKAGRMQPQSYATFYDNILTKIMRKPQLYGTGQRIDYKSNAILPPIIESLEKSNKARKAIGLPMLTDGEYTLVSNLE